MHRMAVTASNRVTSFRNISLACAGNDSMQSQTCKGEREEAEVG